MKIKFGQFVFSNCREWWCMKWSLVTRWRMKLYIILQLILNDTICPVWTENTFQNYVCYENSHYNRESLCEWEGESKCVCTCTCIHKYTCSNCWTVYYRTEPNQPCVKIKLTFPYSSCFQLLISLNIQG
jgi:hypothetical protein